MVGCCGNSGSVELCQFPVEVLFSSMSLQRDELPISSTSVDLILKAPGSTAISAAQNTHKTRVTVYSWAPMTHHLHLADVYTLPSALLYKLHTHAFSLTYRLRAFYQHKCLNATFRNVLKNVFNHPPPPKKITTVQSLTELTVNY